MSLSVKNVALIAKGLIRKFAMKKGEKISKSFKKQP